MAITVSASFGEQPTKLSLPNPEAPHVGKLEISSAEGGDFTLKGPLPSFVKVWPADDSTRLLEFTFNTDATQITVHLGERKADTLEFLLTEETAAHDDGVVVLSALDAQVVGDQAQLETHPGSHRIGFWTNSSDYVVWDTEIPSGQYTAELVYSRATKTGTRATIVVGETEFPITLEQTGSWYRYRVMPLGDLILPADKENPSGKTHIEVRVDEMINGGVMNLKAIVLTPKAVAGKDEKKVSYSRDVRQILSDRCFLCHGPDEAARQASLRLDKRESATEWAIVPGDAAGSEVMARILSNDPDLQMPPPESNKKPLTAEEVDTLKQWIAEGAHYENHWAFESPKRPRPPQSYLPDGDVPDWNSSPIDQFVLAELKQLGRTPSKRADRRTLLRRASLDLTGLPPTPQQLREFLLDDSAGAWSRALDRLLDSPAYGEHQARHWLDAARYADTNGYQYDFGRDQWAWRDWVIASFNNNLPFDQFTMEQLAGDLLPQSTPQQQLATGFNRNHPITVEGGIIDEEYRVEYVLDRTTTAGTVWLGLTLSCARCHDHKYDPLTQKEFYQLSAFFNQVPERGMQGFDPKVKIPSPFQAKNLEAASQELADARQDFWDKYDAWNPDVDMLTEQLQAERNASWQVVKPHSATSLNGATLVPQQDNSLLAAGKNPDHDTYEVVLPAETAKVASLRLIAMPDISKPEALIGRSANGNFVLSEIQIEASTPQTPDKFEPVKIANATATYSQSRYDIKLAIDGQLDSLGWAVYGKPGSVQQPQVATFAFDQPVAPGSGAKIKVRLQFRSDFPRHQMSRFQLATSSATGDDQFASARTALEKPADKRSPAERLAVARLLTRVAGDENLKKSEQRLVAARRQHDKLMQSVPETMVMKDRDDPNGAYVLERGEYDKRGEHVQADTPAWLPPMPEDLPRNRLGFAKWLTLPDHPLTSRVAVNRLWLQLFGVGLLESPEDFGLQSPMPSHPELLDWLAVEFVESGWDTKQLFKTIMTSQTYQQSSAITPEAFDRDPDNRYLARGPRVRLDAEAIRDSALAISGLLNAKIGGPSVFPYHPQGLWLEINNRPGYSSQYKQDTGTKLYRRSLYTYWKRTVTPPSMAVFDAPSREYCQVRRSRTNTPLQAFVMLHDPQFVEAARELARRMLSEGGPSLENKIQYGFELAVSRQPTPREQRVLVEAFNERLAYYQTAPDKAEQVLAVGESPLTGELPTANHAAMTIVARLLMNLSEFITKG